MVNAKPDRSPEQYDDLLIEAIPIAPVGDDEVIVGFQLWDQDDFDVASTILFRVKSFREVQRLAVVDELLFDLKVVDRELYALGSKTLHVFSPGKSPGTYKAPAARELPIRAARAFGGNRDALWVVGGDATRFDGKRWTTTKLGKDDQLRALHVRDDRAVAAGDHGLVVELGDAKARRSKVPGQVTLSGIQIDKTGVLAVAAGTAGRWGGKAEKLVRLAGPDDVGSITDVCEFRGKRTWSASAPGGGVFVEDGHALARIWSESAWHLTATERFLYAAGEREVFRFDGERWQVLRIAFGAKTGRWSVAPHEPGAAPTQDAGNDVVIVVGTYDVKKPGPLEKSLGTLFDQRFVYTNLKVWKKPDGFPPLVGEARDFSFVLDAGRCTFTVPLQTKDLEPLRKFLGKAANLELRRGDAGDVAKNTTLKKSSGKPPKILEQKKGKPIGKKPSSVSVVFDYVDGAQPAYDLTALDGEVIGFGGHKKGPQLDVITGLIERTIANLVYPSTQIHGISIGPGGVLHAGSDGATLYASHDRGRSWEDVAAPGLRKILAGKPIKTTCWFEGELFVASEDTVARRTGGAWTSVPLPKDVEMPGMYEPTSLVVSSGALYLLGIGVARWDGRAMVTELGIAKLPKARFPAAVQSLATTAKGTMLAGSNGVMRKPAGKAWTQLKPAALGIKTKDDSADASYVALVVVGETIVLVGNTDNPSEQLHAVRISDDDGATFRCLPIAAKGKVVTSSAVADPEGGVLIAGFGGLLLRVTC